MLAVDSIMASMAASQSRYDGRGGCDLERV